MTETISPADRKIHPSEVLMRVIVALLTPAFIAACDGDITIARLAALETIKQYNPRSHADLIVIAQVIACGLAAAASGVMSLRSDLSASMALRLRTNASALSRVAERAGRTLAGPSRTPVPVAPAEQAFSPEDAEYEAKVIAGVAASQARVNGAIAAYKAAQRTAEAVPGTPPAPTPSPFSSLSNEQWDAMWATAMSEAEADVAAELENLPPAERDEAIRKANMLGNVARQAFAEAAAPGIRQGDANPQSPTPAATGTSSRRNG